MVWEGIQGQNMRPNRLSHIKNSSMNTVLFVNATENLFHVCGAHLNQSGDIWFSRHTYLEVLSLKFVAKVMIFSKKWYVQCKPIKTTVW